MKYVKLITLSLGLVVLSVLAFVGVAGAQSFRSGNTVSVAANETVDSMLFVAGTNIDIAGEVNGDIYCAGQTITISGKVNGDVFCAGQSIIVSGDITGSVRLGGQSVTLSGNVAGSATIGTQDLVIDKNGRISRDLLGGSQNVTINGGVGRDVVSGSESMSINGSVGRNIKGGVEDITVGPIGLVGGGIDYIGTNDPVVSSGGKIVGTVKRTAPKEQPETNSSSPMVFSIAGFIYAFLAMLVTALILVALFPRLFDEATEKALKSPGTTVLVGLGATIFAPVLIILLLISAIGAPLAILAVFFMLLVMILSGPFVAYLLGRMIMRQTKSPFWVMFVGASALIVTYFIPIVGFVTMMVGSLIGTGMILMQTKKLTLRNGAKKTA